LRRLLRKYRESKKIDNRKRYQSKSPFRTKKDPLEMKTDIVFDASDISDIEKLIMSDAYRNLIDFFHKQDLSKWINLPEIAVMGDTSSGKSLSYQILIY
jgi:hypothetical protein